MRGGRNIFRGGEEGRKALTETTCSDRIDKAGKLK